MMTDSYITTCECSHQTHVGQHGDIINASKHYIYVFITYLCLYPGDNTVT